MKRPSRIDGHHRICCNSRVGQCDDCPMKVWAAELENMGIEWMDGWWMRNGVRYATYEQAHIGRPDAMPGETYFKIKNAMKEPPKT